MAVSALLLKWLDHYDPVHRGWTLSGIANGVCTTNGFFFPRVRGGYNLRRSKLGTPGPEAAIVGAAGADANEIHTFGWVTHPAQSAYQYRLTSIGGGGVENRTGECLESVRFDFAGSWEGPSPNSPSDLHLAPLSGGRFRVCWSYCPAGQRVQPQGFLLFANDGDEIDYGSKRADVVYVPGRLHYEHITPPRPDGSRVGWAVRAYVEDHRTDANRIEVFAHARAAAAPVNPTILVKAEP